MGVRALCAFALVATVGTARADGFVWDAPAACPDAADVQQRIERRLGTGVDVHGIEVSVTRGGKGFIAHIDTRAITVANDGRTLESRKCDDLADAVAVIVARLATEARQQQRRAASLDAAVLEMPAVLARESPLEQPVRVARPVAIERNPTWGGGVRALALSGIGMVPGVGVGGELAGFVRRRDTFAELGYARWAETPMYLVVGAPGRVDVGLHLLAVRGGWASRQMPLRAWVGAELGTMTGSGVALRDPRVGTGRWIAVASGFGVAWPMSPHTRLVGTFEVAAAVERTRFALVSGSEIYQAAPVSARCALGLEVGWR